MNRNGFVNNPQAYLWTRRDGKSPAEYASPVERFSKPEHELAGAIVGFIAALGAAVLIFHKVAEVLK